jgi:two-component system, NtrC family, response regulator AtoC
MAQKILLIDQDSDRGSTLRAELSLLGYEIFHATDRLQALNLPPTRRFDAILADTRALRAGAGQATNVLQNFGQTTPIIVLTDLDEMEEAAKALRAGAFLYLVRPVSRDQLQAALERALATGMLNGDEGVVPVRSKTTVLSPSVLGFTGEMHHVLIQALKASQSDANVFLFGESGTGKELFAHAIHARSTRAKHPFVPVDCAAIPENLLEAELFGYEKGSFTGAAGTKAGLMEAANHGTLFLDEVAELPLSLQPKLLRALQERQHRRLGGLKFIDFDMRVISATNRDLHRLVHDGRFRDDLFYRLHVLPIRLPPLRERPHDVAILAQHFLTRYGGARHPPIRTLEPDTVLVLQKYPWPGNVRELQNAIEYACAVAEDDTIRLCDLPLELHSLEKPGPEPAATGRFSAKFKTARARFEIEWVSELLKRHNGNVSAAAKAAEVDRKTLYYLLNKHQLSSARDIPAHRPPLRVVKS